MPALRFKTCRLLLGNVWKKKLTEIQRRILQRLRRKGRYHRQNLSLRQNSNSYLKLQAIRKLSLFYGNLPIKNHFSIDRGTERASYIPFLLNLETRLDVILVRLHFCETIPQARQLISHGRIRVNNAMVNMNRFQVSHGDLISIEESYVGTMGRKVRKFFYIERFVNRIVGKKVSFCIKNYIERFINRIVVDKDENYIERVVNRIVGKKASFCIKNYINKFINRIVGKNELKSYLEGVIWRRIQPIWFRLLEKRQGCHLLLLRLNKKPFFLRLNKKPSFQRWRQEQRLWRQEQRQEQGLRRQEQRFGWVRNWWQNWWRRRFQRQEQKFLESRLSRKGVYLGRFFAEHNRMKKDFYYSHHPLWDLPTRSWLFPNNNNSLSDLPYYCFEFPYCGTRKRRIGGIPLPTHYLEVNYRTLKAVVFYGPDISHIPHNIRLKDMNLL